MKRHEDLLNALIARVHNQEVNISFDEIEAVKSKRLQMFIRDNGGLMLKLTDDWPDEERIDIIGQNGNDGDHYDAR